MALRGHSFFVGCFSGEIEKGPGGGLSTEKEHLALYRTSCASQAKKTPTSLGEDPLSVPAAWDQPKFSTSSALIVLLLYQMGRLAVDDFFAALSLGKFL